ncbi:MAG: hypothetical protein FJ403_15655 [Verrucomicrobia bacterium]|nr:hypothetical protein [Verrucomicrobiota bacterium]
MKFAGWTSLAQQPTGREPRTVTLLVTTDGSAPPSTAELLDMAGEAEELVGVPVGFGQLGRS